MPNLIITVECEDPSDLDWLRDRCISPVEEAVELAREENRLDDKVEVTWDIDHDA